MSDAGKPMTSFMKTAFYAHHENHPCLGTHTAIWVLNEDHSRALWIESGIQDAPARQAWWLGMAIVYVELPMEFPIIGHIVFEGTDHH